MEITRRAQVRIRQLKSRGVGLRAIGVRLGLETGTVYLKWDSSGPQEDDLVVLSQDFPIFVDARDYLHLSDYTLDFDPGAGSRRFLLRRNPS